MGATMPFLGYDVAVLTRKKRTLRGQRRVNDLKTSGNTRKKTGQTETDFSLTTGREHYENENAKIVLKSC